MVKSGIDNSKSLIICLISFTFDANFVCDNELDRI